ncbi:hypothetical protein FACS1894191_7650 [Clostridia bacterium]|nr:hypothetical protein FACS1894191_7650 [Clostridia bacterium]
MEVSAFSKAYDNMKSKKKLDYFFPPETVYSYPVSVRREEQLYDGVFAYLHDEVSESAPRPFGWVLFSGWDLSIKLVSECAAADFANPAEYPPDMTVSLALPRPIEPRKLKALQKELMATYEWLRQFVFEDSLNREQVAVVVKYKDLFMQLCPKGLYPFYHALSPAFFHWLRLPLPERDLASIPDAAAEDDTRAYQYQLLVLENLQQLVKQFQDKIAVDGHKERLFDNLHKEVQDYKNGLLDSLTRHMELDVIGLIDSLAKTVAAFAGKPGTEENYRRLYTMLEGTETDLRDILYRQGVDPFTLTAAEVDATRQNTVSTVPTGDRALDKKIAAHLAPGWTKDGRVIRPERVSVYMYGGE